MPLTDHRKQIRMIVRTLIIMVLAGVLDDEGHSQSEVSSKQMNHNRSTTVSDGDEINQNVLIDCEEYAFKDD